MLNNIIFDFKKNLIMSIKNPSYYDTLFIKSTRHVIIYVDTLNLPN